MCKHFPAQLLACTKRGQCVYSLTDKAHEKKCHAHMTWAMPPQDTRGSQCESLPPDVLTESDNEAKVKRQRAETSAPGLAHGTLKTASADRKRVMLLHVPPPSRTSQLLATALRGAPEGPKHDVMEIYSCPRVVPIASKEGLLAQISIDIKLGHDLGDPGCQMQILSLIAKHRPQVGLVMHSKYVQQSVWHVYGLKAAPMATRCSHSFLSTYMLSCELHVIPDCHSCHLQV